MKEPSLYNTRILKNFAEYISEYHPQVDLVPILDYAGITTYQLEDDAHWLTQTQVDRFYEILVKAVGDHDLARKVGQCATLSQAGGALSQFTLGFMTPSAAYLALEKLYSHASRGSTIKPRRVSSTKVEIVAIQNPGVTEKPYQCENRLGSFESIAKLFTNELARIEHTTCMHTSGDRCIYNITWTTTPSAIWKRIANYSYLLCLITCLFLFFTLTGGHGAMAVLSMILVVMGISLYQVHLEKDELATSFKNHCDTSSSLLDEINTRYNNALLVQEIGKATSIIPDIDKLIPAVMKLIEKHLDFDHGMILLADKEKTQLIYKAGFGNDPEMMAGSGEIKYHIDKPESKSAVIKAFLEQKPCLIDDTNKVEGDFPDRSKNTSKHRGINLFMCVPIVFEKESLGVLMVDNAISKRALLESDMSLMTGIASQIAVSITNASYFLKQKQVTEELKASLSLLSASLESTADGILIVDGKGKIVRWNQKFADMWKIPEEILSSRDDEKAINHILAQLADPEQFVAKVRKLYEHPEESSFDQIEFLDGRVFERYSQPQIIGDNIAGRVWSFRDITKRKQAEEQLKESEDFLNRTGEIARVGGWYLSGKFDKVFWTQTTGRIHELPDGYYPSLEEAINYYHPDYRALVTECVEAAINEGKPFNFQTRLITAKGNQVWVQAIGHPKMENGKCVRLSGTFQDITEHKQAEEEKRSLLERLNRAEKMESLGLLAGGVAHDLNNVLGIVVGYAELLLLKESKSNANKPLLMEIMNGGQKAAAIVDDLLTLARRGVLGSNILNLNSIISNFQKSPEFKQLSSFHSSVQIKTELEHDLLNISGSTVHLGKTIFNLVSNASEAMKKGGFVTIKTANQYLDKPVQEYDEIQEGDYVVLSVSDTGEGIHEADLKRIFEPFYTKKVMGRSGTGLGLSVVWGTVKDHNGYINVQSEEGKGSTFTLYFPVTREELSVDHVAVPISEYMGKGESILIVDDVKGQRYLAEEMLKKLNYRVSSVSSGEEAVAYLKEHKADLMVLDMIMDPGMDGLDTYRSVLEIRPKQKAIIVSGFSESDRVKAARVLGAGAYVRKPYVIEKLGLAVRKELDRST